MKRIAIPSSPSRIRLKVKSYPAEDVALTCRVRLARNLSDHIFPSRASDTELSRVFGVIEQAVRKIGASPAGNKLAIVDSLHFSHETCNLFYEQHMVSREFCDLRPGSGIITNTDASLVTLVNEEDHLRIQGFAKGCDLRTAWKLADTFDNQLGDELHFAWTPRLGYLTACPSNVGTGLRASVMLHLIGLHLTGDLESATRGLERLHLQLRGSTGEGSDPTGEFVQISNATSLGLTDQQVVETLERVSRALIEREIDARKRLVRTSPLVIADTIERALAVLSHARLLRADEATELLSALRLGASLKLLTGLDVPAIDRIIDNVQPEHFREIEGKNADDPDRRDALRADRLRIMMPVVKLSF